MIQDKIKTVLTEQNVFAELGKLWDAIPAQRKEKGVTFLMSTETVKIICKANGFQPDTLAIQKLFGCPIWYHKMIQNNYVEVVDTDYWQKCLEANEWFKL